MLVDHRSAIVSSTPDMPGSIGGGPAAVTPPSWPGRSSAAGPTFQMACRRSRPKPSNAPAVARAPIWFLFSPVVVPDRPCRRMGRRGLVRPRSARRPCPRSCGPAPGRAVPRTARRGGASWCRTGRRGRTVFAVLEDEVSRSRDGLWVGYFGHACRPDLPAQIDLGPVMPDAVWMHARNVQVIEHETSVGPAHRGLPPAELVIPDSYAEAFAAVQEHLHAGNSYEVNLTYRADFAADLPPVDAYLRLRELNPAPYAGFNSTRVTGCSARHPSGTQPSTPLVISRRGRSKAPHRAAQHLPTTSVSAGCSRATRSSGPRT